MIKTFLPAIGLMAGIITVACNNEAGSASPGKKETDSSLHAASSSRDGSDPASDNRFIPLSLVKEHLVKEVRPSFGLETDTAAALRLQYERRSEPSLQLQAEIQRDAQRLERMVQTWIHHPDLQEEFSAGDQAAIVHTEESATSYYTVVFRVNNFFCTISSTIRNGTNAGDGILYSAEGLKKLAADWAEYLKNLDE